MFEGLTTVNIELTSRCNKSCWMCSRRKIERDYPELAKWGDMDYELVKNISRQIPKGIVVQFHYNGEPLLFPRLGEALNLYTHQIRCLDTNGKLLVEKADEIINNLETITISTFEGDSEASEQGRIITKFLEIKGDRKPRVIIRRLGNADFEYNYKAMGLLIVNRAFRSPEGNFDYDKAPPIPEIGICLEAMNHLLIQRDGSVSICVNFDPLREGVIGNANDTLLSEIWNSPQRQLALRHHIRGERSLIPLCRKCDYWGLPAG